MARTAIGTDRERAMATRQAMATVAATHDEVMVCSCLGPGSAGGVASRTIICRRDVAGALSGKQRVVVAAHARCGRLRVLECDRIAEGIRWNRMARRTVGRRRHTLQMLSAELVTGRA